MKYVVCQAFDAGQGSQKVGSVYTGPNAEKLLDQGLLVSAASQEGKQLLADEESKANSAQIAEEKADLEAMKAGDKRPLQEKLEKLADKQEPKKAEPEQVKKEESKQDSSSKTTADQAKGKK